MQGKLLEIISVHFDIASQLLIIYFPFINYLRKNGNTMSQCISYSRKPTIQLEGKPGKIFFEFRVCGSVHLQSLKTPNLMQQSIVKFYCFVVQTMLNMFRALLCPSSGARQTAVAASGFRMNVEVEVFSADHG